MTKVCTKCGIEKEATTENFYKRSSLIAGLSSWCKLCQDSYNKEYWSSHPEQLKIKRQKQRQKMSPEKKAEYKRRHYEKYKERYKQRAKQWRINNPERCQDNDLRKKYGITLAKKRAMFNAQGRKCAACGSDKSFGKYEGLSGWHLDHDHKSGTIRSILCHPCNLTIGNAKEDIERLKKIVEYLEKYYNNSK